MRWSENCERGYNCVSLSPMVLLAGVKNHHKIVFRGEADERPGEIPGDVVLVVEQQASCA